MAAKRQRDYAAEYARRKASRAARLQSAGLPAMGERAERAFRRRLNTSGSSGYIGPVRPSRGGLAGGLTPDQVEAMNRANITYTARHAIRMLGLKERNGNKRTQARLAIAQASSRYDTSLGDRVGDYSPERVGYVETYYMANVNKDTNYGSYERKYYRDRITGEAPDWQKRLMEYLFADNGDYWDDEFGEDIMDEIEQRYGLNGR